MVDFYVLWCTRTIAKKQSDLLRNYRNVTNQKPRVHNFLCTFCVFIEIKLRD